MSHDEKNSEHESVPSETAQSPDELKREFLRRFGKLAATTPATVFVLMSTHSSRAVGASDGAPF